MGTITGDRQAFFQTANSESRLFLEYDPGQQSVLQFGIANPDESVQLIKLGNLKRTGSFLFTFIMTNDGTIDLWVAGAAIHRFQAEIRSRLECEISKKFKTCTNQVFLTTITNGLSISAWRYCL